MMLVLHVQHMLHRPLTSPEPPPVPPPAPPPVPPPEPQPPLLLIAPALVHAEDSASCWKRWGDRSVLAAPPPSPVWLLLLLWLPHVAKD